jgi:hypothetical protein
VFKRGTEFLGLSGLGSNVIEYVKNKYSRTLDCEKLGLRVFYKTSKNFEGILT